MRVGGNVTKLRGEGGSSDGGNSPTPHLLLFPSMTEHLSPDE